MPNTIKITNNVDGTKTITGLTDADMMLVGVFLAKGITHASADEKMWPVCDAVTRLASALRHSAMFRGERGNAHLVGATPDASILYTAAN